MDYLKLYTKKSGLPPGTLTFVGEQKLDQALIHLIQYHEEIEVEKDIQDINESQKYLSNSTVTWIDICGVHDVSLIKKIGELFSIHPLVQEDILHMLQRPKMEEIESYIFFVLKMFYFEDQNIVEEQISMILGDNYVITFQEKPGDIFDPLRERIRSGKFKITKAHSDYLAYSIIDAIVDNYFVILEDFGEKIELVEDALLMNSTHKIAQEIHTLKRKILLLRRSVWPLRELINKMNNSESTLIKKTTKIYLRDIYDHTIQVIDTIENYRDILYGMLDTYLSSINIGMNEIMKTLTIIATIFIPLTFITGIYGMNFEFMPELKWALGYFIVLGFMIFLSGIMLLFFKRKKWL